MNQAISQKHPRVGMVTGYGELLPELKYYNYSSMDLYNAFLGRVQIKFRSYYFNVIIASCDAIKNLNKNHLFTFT